MILALGFETIQLLGVLRVGTAIDTPMVVEVMLVMPVVADARARDNVLARYH